jgi:hypothetical protein
MPMTNDVQSLCRYRMAVEIDVSEPKGLTALLNYSWGAPDATRCGSGAYGPTRTGRVANKSGVFTI